MTATDTNGTTQDTGSLLDTLAAEFEKTFKGKTTDKRKGELVKALTAAKSAVADAEHALERASKAESDAVAAIIREASGRSRITIKGETFSPASRGSKVYLRKVSAESIELA